MTQFFNLESYTECCQYTALFNEDIAKFIPTSEKNTLPLAYKKFLSDYGDRPFLEPPALLSQFPQSFQPRPATLKPKMIGLSIEDGENDHVFIVREVNSLDIGSLNAQYIYANVYRYWNYAPQLEHLASSHKPMVIYDLDSFTPLKIIPLTFIDHSNSLHRIPIVDTRIVEEYKDFKLYSIEQNSEFVKYESCLDNIYQAITHEITANLSMNSRYFTEVYGYLKKINLFRLTSLSQEQILPICLKTNENFFRYDLDLESLVACIIDHLPLKSLSEIIDENKENYNFVLISQFNNLQGFRENIKKQFQNCLTIPNITTEYFDHAWQESQILKFPLYGQNLDKISFFIMEKNEKKAISLPGKICYQGEPEIFVNAEYNHQEFFPIPLKSDHVSLPFEINNAIYTRNEIEQQYKIYNPDYDPAIDTQDHLKVRICFRLQPGKPPKLEVRDETGRMLKSELVDREEVPEEKSINQGYIPTSKIIENCNNISRKNLKELIESDFIADLKKFSFKISEYDYELNFLQVIDEINNFKTKLDNEYSPESSKEYWTQILKMNGFSVELQEIIDIYQSLDHNINNIISDIPRSVNNIKEIICNIENRLSKPIKRQEATLKKKELTIKKEVLIKLGKVQQNLLLIFGKSYFLTSKMSLSFISEVLNDNFVL